MADITLPVERPDRRIDWQAELLMLPYPMPRKFSRIPTFQWKEVTTQGKRKHQQLLLWVGLTRHWLMCYTLVTCYPEDMTQALDILNLLEQEEDVPKEPLLSSWNRDRWDYLPDRYPVVIRKLFEDAHLELKPRYPWIEKSGVYKHDKP